jgi:hypothetical protein
MTRPELERFVAQLDPALQAIFRAADRFVRDCEDTLSSDFQIAAAVVKAFEDQAEGKERPA